MTRKPVAEIDVIERLTEGQVKSLGCSRWFKRHYKPLCIGLALYFVIMTVTTSASDKVPLWVSWAFVGLLAVFVVWFMFKMDRVGKAFWRSVKDQSQPVDIREASDK